MEIIILISKANIEQRDGEDYMTIGDMFITATASDVEIDFEYQNVPHQINGMMNGVYNSNWRIIKGIMDPIINKFLVDSMGPIIKSMFQETSMQDLFMDE